MIAFEPERIQEKKKKIQDFLWSVDSDRYPDKCVHDMYQSKLDKWVENATVLRKDSPGEIGFFLAQNYLSSFFYRYVTDEMSLLRSRKRYTRVEKIQIIKDSFENAYHHFGLLAISSNYSEAFKETLFDQWFSPSIAKEHYKIQQRSCWKNDSGEAISGKEWAILNLPFLEVCSFDPLVLKDIREADSHGRIVYESNRVIVLSKKGEVAHILSNKKLDKVFKFVVSSIRATAHFNIHLLLRKNFWVTPAIILTKPEAFNFSEPKLPDIPEATRKKKKSKRKEIIEESEEPIHRRNKLPMQDATEYAMVVIDFLVNELWSVIDRERCQINDLLAEYDLEFDFDQFGNAWGEVKYEFLQSIVTVVEKMNYVVTESEYVPIVIDKDNLDKFKWEEFMQESLQKWKGFKKDATQEQRNSYYAEFFIGGAVILFSPIGKFMNSLSELIKEKSVSE